jgi:RNA-binding protein
MTKDLPPARRSALRGEAHKLKPVVIIGDKGLTDEVMAEIDRSLTAHELIKVRAAGGERDVRETWLDTICTRLAAHPVQRIGKVFVIYRENPEEEKPKAPARPAAKGAAASEERLARGREKQRAKDEKKRKARDIEEMRAKGKIPANARVGDEARRPSRPRARASSALPESLPPRRRPRT